MLKISQNGNKKGHEIKTKKLHKCSEISKLLRTGKMFNIQVGTTEEFQGTEKDAIIVSTVRSNEQLLNFDARTGLGFVSQKKRTCVTLTR